VHNASLEKPSDESIDSYHKAMRHFWHPVLPASELPEDKPVGVELLGEPVVLVRLNGDVVGMQDLCRHFQARLSLGEIIEQGGEKRLMCIYHGWTYDKQGVCVHIPQLAPGRAIPADAKVPSYMARECHDLIWVCLEQQPKFDIPDFPELYDQSFHPGPLRVYDPWKASAPRIIMGALDDTHFPWLHEGILGTREQTDPPNHKVWREGRYLVSEYDIIQPPNFSTTDVTSNGASTDGKKITYTNYVGIPGVIRLVKKGEKRTRYVIWAATCPHRYNSTTTFWRVARNYDLDPSNDYEYETFEDKVRSQDKPVVESQRPWLLPPFWTKIELPLRPADLPLIEYQKWLEELDITVAV
jgi:phenylpropionate dioxygenase-like ring-hydroxylating dioxygenase large terminal subunit